MSHWETVHTTSGEDVLGWRYYTAGSGLGWVIRIYSGRRVAYFYKEEGGVLSSNVDLPGFLHTEEEMKAWALGYWRTL